MNGTKNIKFNGVDRLYDAYSWRLTRRAKKVWSSGKVLLGEQIRELEKKFCKKYSRKHAVAVGSATDGLYFAMKGHGLAKNSSVVCPALSYVATYGAIKRLGASVRFIDTEDDGNIGNIGMQAIPSAVLYVNLYGNPARFDLLQKYCQEHKIPLIEDAAQSMGAYFNKIPSGRLGDTSVFSFDPQKNLPCFGSGGMVLTDDDNVYNTIISLRRHGLQGKFVNYGYNSVIPEDHCAQLIFLLDKFESLQKQRTKIRSYYKKFLPGYKFIEPMKNCVSSNHKLIILTDKRDQLRKYLADRGIETKIHYNYILPKNSLLPYTNAQYICDNNLSLPIYPFLEKSEVKFVCDNIKEFYGV